MVGSVITLIIGLGIGALVGYFLGKQQGVTTEQPMQANAETEKEKNLNKVRDFIKSKDKFTNDDIEKLLDVSNATVGRYLEDLEQAGEIKQVGKTGKYVYYTRK